MEGNPMRIVSMPPVFEKGIPDKATLDNMASFALECAEEELERQLHGVNMNTMSVRDLKSKIMRSPLLGATRHINELYRHKVFYRALELYHQALTELQGRRPVQEESRESLVMYYKPNETNEGNEGEVAPRVPTVVRVSNDKKLIKKWKIPPDQAARNIALRLGGRPESDQP